MVINLMFGRSLRLLAELRFENLRVGGAKVCELVSGIEHLEGDVVRGSDDRGSLE